MPPGPLARLRLRLPGQRFHLLASKSSCRVSRLTCSGRLAQCADVLQRHLLHRLRLCDVQALRHTCRALRLAVDGAQPEIEALALVHPVNAPPELACQQTCEQQAVCRA